MVDDYHSLLPIHNYQRNRILTFVAPDVVDPSGTGASWNANQAKISAATGGLSGKGLFRGTQAQLGYLPQAVAHNDFIFSVIAEETGFLGSAFIVGLFCLMVANGIRIAGLARDRFGMQLAHWGQCFIPRPLLHQHWHDYRHNPDYWTTASVFKLRRLLCFELLYFTRSCTKCISVSKGFFMIRTHALARRFDSQSRQNLGSPPHPRETKTNERRIKYRTN